jgi:hypothetical protein
MGLGLETQITTLGCEKHFWQGYIHTYIHSQESAHLGMDALRHKHCIYTLPVFLGIFYTNLYDPCLDTDKVLERKAKI